MFFVHPQIKLNRENLKRIFFSFLGKSDFVSLKKKLSLMFTEKQLVFTDMGRSAFKIIVEKLNLQNSQIIMPAYICDIFYPILKQYNIKPIFLDIDLNTFNVNPDKISQSVTPQTKAILVAHTYGLPVDMERIKEIKGPIIIEDCAHTFGARYQNEFVGNFGQASFFSLYKQFPTFRGGLLICPNNWDINLSKTSFNTRDFISFLNSFPFFSFLFKTFGEKAAEKMPRKEKTLKPSALNSVSLNFFSYFLEDYEEPLRRRIALALFFQEELKKLGLLVQESTNNVFCYLSALVPKELEGKRDELVKKLRREGVFCTRMWNTSRTIILNPDVQQEYNIDLNEFPNTVEAANRVINFPLQNHYTKKDIEKIIQAIKKVLTKL
ncbi:MAG: DegT/DnrJ/EryC1/StrS family aminotransferase [Patescibacteria group bacterium]|nr:DegT/DnrJ/EryC1/StrS family aminotransferase [Patescibacteria group bacterium]